MIKKLLCESVGNITANYNCIRQINKITNWNT